MAKETFVRTKPHVNIGTIGHVVSTRLTMLQKRRSVVSLSTLLTSSMRQQSVTMLTWTALDTPTM